MPTVSDLPPLLLQVMRTGVMPSHAEIAAATGKSVDEVKRALEPPHAAADEDEAVDGGPEDPEAQRFRDEYHRLVAVACSEWLDENMTLDNTVPASIRADIESECNAQVQRQWRTHLRAQRGDEDLD